MNTFGRILRFTGFGESHGVAVGGVLEGLPAGSRISLEKLAVQMARRRPGQSAIVTQRNEPDSVEILSGVTPLEDDPDIVVAQGTPIAFMVRNTNQRSQDYREIAGAFRPSHADYTYFKKYDGNNDIRGGGRTSARETLARVAAGSMAAQVLAYYGIDIVAYTIQVGEIKAQVDAVPTGGQIESNPVRCPHQAAAALMENLIKDVRDRGDTVGGVVECVVTGCPVGLGQPVFGKLNASLAAAMMSINAAKGFEIGMGFEGCTKRGSQVIDTLVPGNGALSTTSNNSGGIQGGLSNGMPIVMRVAFKPVATLLQPVQTVDTQGNPTVLKSRGRHDPCVVPRAVPIVEAMAALVILDNLLLDRCTRL